MAERFAASRLVAKSRPGVKVAADSLDCGHASLASRSLAYLIDSLVLFGFAGLFLTLAGLNILLRTSGGETDPSDTTISSSVAIAMATIPAWFLFNLLLNLVRGQSIGQYVVGLRVTREDGREASALRHVIHWFALHPLLFHPLLAFFWLLLAYVGLSLATADVILFASSSIALLCVVAPIVSLFFALSDAHRRGLHDLIAGTKLVRIA